MIDTDHKWATLIGRVFIAFGSIERLTHECLRDWLGHPVYSHIKNASLSRRIDLLIDVTKTQDFESNNIDPFIDNLKRAKSLAEKRNLIAHNPLQLCLFYGREDFDIEAITSSLKDDVTMEFHELQEVADESEKLADELVEGRIKFKLEKWPGLPNIQRLNAEQQNS